MVKLAPSILSADFSKIEEQLLQIEAGGADLIHLDVMDGHFVPNITFGPPVIKKLRKITKLPFDIHLMIDRPERYIKDFVDAGADIITIHQESTLHLHRTLQLIKGYGIRSGVALNPATPLETIKHILGDVDMILIMTVNPGFGGQSLIESMKNKIEELRNIINDNHLNIDIQVDGGVKIDNIKEVSSWGANIMVVGSAIFETNDIISTTKRFKEIVTLQY